MEGVETFRFVSEAVNEFRNGLRNDSRPENDRDLKCLHVYFDNASSERQFEEDKSSKPPIDVQSRDNFDEFLRLRRKHLGHPKFMHLNSGFEVALRALADTKYGRNFLR